MYYKHIEGNYIVGVAKTKNPVSTENFVGITVDEYNSILAIIATKPEDPVIEETEEENIATMVLTEEVTTVTRGMYMLNKNTLSYELVTEPVNQEAEVM